MAAPDRRKFLVQVIVEAKDEYYPENTRYAGELPGQSELASRLQDILADVTKNDEQIGWRVTEVMC